MLLFCLESKQNKRPNYLPVQ